MNGVIWLIVLPGMLFAAGAYAQISPAPDDNGGTTPGAVPAKFDAGFYQKIQDLIESERARLQTSHQKIPDPDGPRGASDAHDGELYYNVIIVVGRDGDNPDETARENKDAITQHLNSLGARDIVAAESLSFVTAFIPVTEIPSLSLREEIRQIGDGELPLTPQVDTARQTIRAEPSYLRQSAEIVPNGTGVTVAVIDRGINSTHLNDKVVDRTYCDPSCGEQPHGIISGKFIKFVGNNTYIFSFGPIYATHGTQVAGVLAASGMRSNNGISSGVTLLDALHDGTTSSVILAIDWSYSRGADVINMSLGSLTTCSVIQSAYNMIINEAVDNGMVLVVPAGNSASLNYRPNYQSVYNPACAQNVITVGGINDRGSEVTMYTRSSRGPTSDSEPRLVPHIVAPAVDLHLLQYSTNDTTGQHEGTSLATPQVSAAAAILLQVNPELIPAGVRAALLLGANWTGPVPCTSAQYEQSNTNDPCSFARQPAGLIRNSLKILNNVGFGILNVAESLRYVNSSSPHIILDHLDAATRTHTYKLDVTDTSRPVKVILTWMVNHAPLFKDLNLEILAPEGSIINASSVYQTTEFAVFNPSVTGTYTIKVQGSDLDWSDRANQTFALASTSRFVTIAIDAVENQAVNVHSTLRLDITARNATGPVRYGIDPLEGAYIHPVSGHLVYVPVAGQQGLQNITVRAADNQTIDSITIQVAVGEPIATVTGIEAGPDGTHVATVDVGPDDVTGMFAARTHAGTTVLSNSTPLDAGTSAARFVSDVIGSDHPRNNTIYYFTVWSGSSADPDDRIYARFTPGQSGPGIIIPNPGTRPAHHVPDLDVTVGFNGSATVVPHLADNDGNPVRITGVTDGTEGAARTNGTAVTYTLKPGTTGDDTITYTTTDNAGLQVNGTITTEFKPFVINIDNPTVRVHGTLRLDIEAQDAKGPVTWSVDEKAGARIHPVTGHLVYVPTAGQVGPQTLTVRAGDGIRNASVDIVVFVVEPIGTIISVKLSSGYWHLGEYASNNPTIDSIDYGIFSDGAFTKIGCCQGLDARFAVSSFLPPSEPYTLYFGAIRSDYRTPEEVDSNMYFQLVPGKTGFTIIPNPHTRPDPFAPDIAVSANSTDTPVHVMPELVSIDGSPVNITAVTNGTRGKTTHSNTTIIYTPDAGAGGADTVNYTVTDDRGVSSTAMATIILPDIPLVARNDNATTYENVTVSIPVLDNDEGNDVTVTVPAQPGRGSAEPESDGTITYIPEPGHNGRVIFMYVISRDGENRTAAVTVTIHEPITFQAPQNPLGAESIAIPELELYTFNINITNADNVDHTVGLDLGEPPATAAAITQSGNFTWMPTESQGPGLYQIAITVDPASEGAANVTEQIALSVIEANQNPVFDTVSIPPAVVNEPFRLDLNADDADIPEQTVSYQITGQNPPTNPAVINDTTGMITWTPTDAGTKTITVLASDDHVPNGTASMDITITVTDRPTANTPPTARDIFETVTAGRSVSIDLSVSNRIDDGQQAIDTLAVSISDWPSQGNATVQNTTITYTARDNATDADTFNYTVTDDHNATEIATVTVKINPAPQVGNIADPDGRSTVIAQVTDTAVGNVLRTYMLHGLVVFAGIHPAPEDTANTIPAGAIRLGSSVLGFAGFLHAGIIKATDADRPGAGWNDAAALSVFINEIGNVPPVLSEIGHYTINARDTLTFAVSATDFNDTVSYRLSGASNGAEISRQGKFSWTPGSADEGGHAFAITAHDGQNATDTESVTITVLPAGTPNESPIAPDVAAAVSPNDRVIIIPAISDPDGDPVRITGATGDAGGAIIPSDNGIEYTAGPNQGTETVTYTVVDSRGASVTGTISVTIE